MEKSESEIQREILDTLRRCGYSIWRMPLGGVRHSGGGTKKNPLSGFPDLFGIMKNRRGVLFAIEVKTTKGKVSPKQLEWNELLNALGAVSMIATSASEALEMVKKHDRIDS